MSIANIKELFCKRVQESVSLNNDNDTAPFKNLKAEDTDIQEESNFTGLKEIDVGITEYLNDCKGFNAVIKQRFSDFHVHEIDRDGKVVYLNNTHIPVIEEEPINEDTISTETWEDLKRLKEKIISTVEIDVTDLSKEKRKEIHRAIKFKYGLIFVSNTLDKNNKKIMVISLKSETKQRNPQFSETEKYLHFVLFKKNLDTVDAINIIASKLRTKASNLAYAGTKDKRGITSQWVSMWHLDAKRLDGINKMLRDMRVGNYVYRTTPLKLGDLKGNLFEIALRNVTECNEVVTTALNFVKENGFINYFGLQRFGNSAEIPTHIIGKALLKGDFKTAVELILKPRKGRMRNDLRDARHIWWETRDAERALKCLHSKDRTIEGKLLSGLVKHGENAYLNALDCIPRNVRLLYLHAYQSFIWNKVLSRRVKEFGKCVLEGDLVLSSGYEEIANDILETVEEELVEDEVILESNNEKESLTSGPSVKILSKKEISNYNIADVVLPLPGFNITYPNNVIKDWFEESLKEDGLTSENLKQTVRKYSLSGTQRHIVKKINDMTWNICNYSEPDDDLLLSDIDRLEQKCLDKKEEIKQQYKAVILKFSLDSSTYATMALREILKIDTSCSYQATLNSYANKRTCENSENNESNKKLKV